MCKYLYINIDDLNISITRIYFYDIFSESHYPLFMFVNSSYDLWPVTYDK